MERFCIFVLGAIVGALAMFSAEGLQNFSSTPTELPTLEEKNTGIIPPSDMTTDSSASNTVLYPVIKVIDGDTLTIDKDGTPTTLRLIGLDTPESSTTRTGSIQCFGKEATERARMILSGTSVSIATDPSQDTYDRYGRLLVYVYEADGTNFNERMIRDGYGHEYTYREPYRYQKEFKAAEVEARSAQRGLWDPDTCSENTVPALSQPAAAIRPTGTYECTKNVYNCTSFKTQAEAQAAFDACGGPAHDIHKLDGNGDGEVCESLP